MTARTASRSSRRRVVLAATEPARTLVSAGALAAGLPLLLRAPRGEPHPVLVLPGLMASDVSTRALRTWLRRLGYPVVGWALGRNRGPTDEVISELPRLVDRLAGEHGTSVSIVGWSLGGIYGRALALREPRQVRQVITLGSPFRQTSGSGSHARRLYDRRAHLHVSRPLAGDGDLAGRLSVPSTAIYSKTDGIVDWRACTAELASDSENVEVLGSHCGLGHNPTVLWIVADRLAQPTGAWRPYKPRLSAGLLGLPAA